MLYELILINEIEQRAKIIFLSVVISSMFKYIAGQTFGVSKIFISAFALILTKTSFTV